MNTIPMNPQPGPNIRHLIRQNDGHFWEATGGDMPLTGDESFAPPCEVAGVNKVDGVWVWILPTPTQDDYEALIQALHFTANDLREIRDRTTDPAIRHTASWAYDRVTTALGYEPVAPEHPASLTRRTGSPADAVEAM